jgi:hypothetical protein
MKQCPKCNRIYDDETLNFCLNDGTTLSIAYDSEATITIPRPFPAVTPPTEVLSNKQQLETRVEPRERKFNPAYIVILILAILLAGSAVALFYERGKGVSTSNIKLPEPNIVNSDVAKSEQSPKILATPTIIQNNSTARYSVSTCNSIKDSRTGLEWYVGPDRNVTWDEAQQWITGLNSCNGGWRMPSLEEIRALYNPATKAGTGYFTSGKHFPAHIDPIFNGIGGGSWVWSNEKAGDSAQSFNLNQGKAVTYSANNTQFSTRAFAVRRAGN